MKVLLLITLLSGYYYSSGQTKPKNNGTKAADNAKQLLPPRMIAPGNYALQPDNMPCVVPDMKTLSKMPNSVGTEDYIPFMPNGYDNKPVLIVQKKPKDKKKF